MESTADLTVRPDLRTWWRKRRRAVRGRITVFGANVSLLLTGLTLGRDGHGFVFACFAAAAACFALAILYWGGVVYRSFVRVSGDVVTWRFVRQAGSCSRADIAEISLDDFYDWPSIHGHTFSAHDHRGRLLFRFRTTAWSEGSIAALRRTLSPVEAPQQ
jgi:hypothetical protein